MKKTRKKILVMIFLVFYFAFSAATALADGALVEYDPYNAVKYDLKAENSQQAVISYENGMQKMVLAVDFTDTSNKNDVWIFPVPASADKIKMDVVSDIPSLAGKDFSNSVSANLYYVKKDIGSTQIYPFVYWVISRIIILNSNSSRDVLGLGSVINETSANSTPDVIVQSHLEKGGMVSEIISAKTADGLAKYFKDKGLNFDNKSIPALQKYFGRDYSFVASWINTGANVSSTAAAITASSPVQNNPNLVTADFIDKAFSFYYGQRGRFPKFAELRDQILDKQQSEPLPPGQFHNDAYFQARQEAIDQALADDINHDNTIVADQLGGQKITVPTQKMIDDYVNGESISVLPQGGQSTFNGRGIYLSFPTDKIYFPLMLTSVYGDKIIPAEIRVISPVAPKIFGNIRMFAKTSYYSNASLVFRDAALQDFYSGSKTDFIYTKIDINAPAKNLTNDLWISPNPSFQYNLISLFNNSLFSFFIILVLSSLLSGIMAGWLLSRFAWKRTLRFALIGFFNVFSLIGLIIAAKFLFVDFKNDGYPQWAFLPRDFRRWLFVPFFSALFMGCTWLIIELIKIII